MPIELNSDGFVISDQSGPEQDYRGLVLPGGGRAPAPAGPMAGPNGSGIPFQPSKPEVRDIGSGGSQRDRRFSDTFFDQHRHPTARGGRFARGRPWTGEREIAAMASRGELPGFVTCDLMQGEYIADDQGRVDRFATSNSVWSAPWVPIAKYFKFNYQQKTIRFDYQRMLIDEQRGYDDYYEAAARLGASLNTRVDYGRVPMFSITSQLGFPTKYLEVAKAAIAGDPWLLGFIDEPNPQLAQILGFNGRGMRILSYNPDPEPLVTPQQVLATPQDELLKLIADMRMKLEAMERERAEERAAAAKIKAARKENMAKARAAKRPRGEHRISPEAPVG